MRRGKGYFAACSSKPQSCVDGYTHQASKANLLCVVVSRRVVWTATRSRLQQLILPSVVAHVIVALVATCCSCQYVTLATRGMQTF